jgi:hypothetical protein
MRPLLVPTLRLATVVRRACVAGVLVASSILPRAALASTCVGSDVPVAGAAFAPRRVEDGLAWDSRFIVSADASFGFTGGPIRFAAPLPAGERMLPAQGLEPIVEGDRIAGLCVQPAALHDRTVHATFVHNTTIAPNRAIPLGAPIAEGEAVQIVETTAGETRIEIASDALEKHVGYVAPRAVSDGAREEARRLTDERPRIGRDLAYVRGQNVGHGLEMRFLEPPAQRRTNAAGVVLVFVALVGGLVLAARKLRARAEEERADALLASEIDRTATGGLR